jgi:hypothetical protein
VWRPGCSGFVAVEKKTPALDVGTLAVQLAPGRYYACLVGRAAKHHGLTKAVMKMASFNAATT